MPILGPKRYAAIVIGTPLAVFFVIAVFVAPAARRAIDEARVGEGYASVRRGVFHVYFPDGRDADAERALDVLDETAAAMLDAFGADLGLVIPEGTLEVFLLKDKDHLEVFGWSDAQADMTNNGGYYAHNRGAMAMVGFFGDDLNEETLAHELCHAILETSARPGSRVPAWIHEGFAQYIEV